ncbi:MAG: DNA mismatch repair protein MutS [Deltaproteobacteria bacterium]|nr:DNA mismatch repair protein MutS [Deltaproteobacteria bacterium]
MEMGTPMFRQYWQIKAQYPDPDTILFFHVGDFYEMFFDDAKTAAPLLEITLTTRNPNDASPIPLCGIPIHAADGYVAKLLAAGKKVALCEQVEDPKQAKGVVRRDVVRVITPGAVLDAEGLNAREHNYLAALVVDHARYGLAVIDISTGEFRATEFGSLAAAREEIDRIGPRELLVPSELPWSPTTRAMTCTPLEAAAFDRTTLPLLAGCDAVGALGQSAAAAIWHYLHYTKVAGAKPITHITTLQPYQAHDYLVLDETTRRNLELLQTLHDGQRAGSLLWLLDRTSTAMGARRLRHWLLYPLRSVTAIDARLDAVQQLMADVTRQEILLATLAGVADLERIAGRIATGHASPRDIIALRDSLRHLPTIIRTLPESPPLLASFSHAIDPCADAADRIAATLVDQPPLSAGDGGVIRDGVDAELDRLRALQYEGKGFIARLEASERARTGIGSLKVRFNRVFGYYLEITHTHRDRVPADYIRKQTLTNAERYITPALKEYEEQVVTAEARSHALEYEHFTRLREELAHALPRIQQSARQVADLDALLALARVAQEGDYCRPTLVEAPMIAIEAGRHPVVERMLRDERFVPNDCCVGMSAPQGEPRGIHPPLPLGRGMGEGETSPNTPLLIITGPNMAGKSTIMRQVGLITLLAHLGSFVPAKRAVIGLTDRIFTRVGASDNVARGQSTFMVEMAEAATILREATAHSLILIDELGRGTSTYDGISIAWAVAEYLHDHVHARTLFATHYHELARLADTKPGVANFTMAVKEWNDRIIFLRTLVPGAADRSYGIEVARLAGLPPSVTTRARELLAELEQDPWRTASAPPAAQLGLFPSPDPRHEAVCERLRILDPQTLTPLAALTLLAELVEQVRDTTAI